MLKQVAAPFVSSVKQDVQPWRFEHLGTIAESYARSSGRTLDH